MARKKKTKSPVLMGLKAVVLVVAGYILAYGFRDWRRQTTPQQDLHYHADMAVYISGVRLDFSEARYQESEDNPLNPDIHFHDGQGKVFHLHKSGVTLGDLFRSFGGDLGNGCLKMDEASFCSNLFSGVKVYINGRRHWSASSYEPQDLDRILVSYGPWFSDVAGETATLSDLACIYSLKCPDRGEPPTENCLAKPGETCVLPGEKAH